MIKEGPDKPINKICGRPTLGEIFKNVHYMEQLILLTRQLAVKASIKYKILHFAELLIS